MVVQNVQVRVYMLIVSDKIKARENELNDRSVEVRRVMRMPRDRETFRPDSGGVISRYVT